MDPNHPEVGSSVLALEVRYRGVSSVAGRPLSDMSNITSHGETNAGSNRFAKVCHDAETTVVNCAKQDLSNRFAEVCHEP